MSEAREWLVAAARNAYEEEIRPLDLVVSFHDSFKPEFQNQIQEVGSKAKIVVADTPPPERLLDSRAMLEELDSFSAYLESLQDLELATVPALPYRRTLSDAEGRRLLSLLETRWGIDGHWYPIDREHEAPPPADAVAFQASPFWDDKLVRALQALLSAFGVARVYELREGGSSVDREIDLDLLRPWYNFDEGFWLDDTGEWVIYASHEGSITVAGARLLTALKQVWQNWEEYTYGPPELGVERQIAPNMTTVSLHVKPPPGYHPD